MEDGWIEWNGGECPVKPETMVEARFDDGFCPTAPREAIGYVIRSENWEWSKPGRGQRIIAYRIAPQAVSAS